MEVVPPTGRHGFQVALICALAIEATYVEALFDKFWEDEGRKYGKAPGDPNSYTTGVMAGHNVVLVHMPGMGKVNAATVAAHLRTSFLNIKLAIVIGICGGVPKGAGSGEEIILGDVVVSQALIQYDFGRKYPTVFARKDTVEDTLSRPSPAIRAILAKHQTGRSRQKMQEDVQAFLKELTPRFPEAQYPGTKLDRLYKSSYVHKHQKSVAGDGCTICDDSHVCDQARGMACEEVGCEDEYTEIRGRLGNIEEASLQPRIHFGKIGSGDTVMKSGNLRDEMATRDGIVAFEMEGAGVWEQFPSIVIKGICDYADSHKNKVWQAYAATTAASCAKSFLKSWTVEDEQPESNLAMLEQHGLTQSHPNNRSMKGEWCAKSLTLLYGLTKDPGLHSQPVWHVPFNQMQSFIGRESEIRDLKDKLFKANHSQSVAIYGLGGVGKSRVAWEMASYARSLGNYSILWVEATSVSTLEKDFLEAGIKLGIPGLSNLPSSFSDSGDKSWTSSFSTSELEIKTIVAQWLSSEQSGRWLMILDNADDESVWSVRAKQNGERLNLSEYIPKSRLGSVLVTTRSRQIALRLVGQRAADVIELQQMNPTEAMQTLNSLLPQSEVIDDQNSEDQMELVNQLSCLPLAIVQAAAYIKFNGLSIYDYLDLLKDAGEEDVIDLLSEDFEDESRYIQAQNPIAMTWLISFQQIKQNHPQAIEVLSFMSCLNENDIPRTLLPDRSSKKEMLEIIGTLTSYSFVRKQPQRRDQIDLFDMHRLVRLATRNWLRSQNTLQLWINKAVKHVTEALPDDVIQNKTYWSLCMPHAETLCADSTHLDVVERCDLHRKVGFCLIRDGAYEAATKYLAAVLQWRVQKGGETAIDAFKARSELGYALTEYGKWTDSEVHLKQALQGQEERLGHEHEDTLVTKGRLAIVYGKRGRWKDAEHMEVKILEASLRIYGPEHRETLSSMGNLALIYEKQQRFKEAESLETQVWELSVKLFGPHDPRTLASTDHLASIYRSLGRYQDATKLNIDTMETSKLVLGPEHPYTLRIMTNLIETYRQQKKWDGVETLVLEQLEISEKVLGFDHPETIESMARLGEVYCEQRRYEEAYQIDKQALDLSEQVLGINDSRTLSRMEDLASTLRRRGWTKEAYAVLSECVERTTTELGARSRLAKHRRERLRRWRDTEQYPSKPTIIRANSS